MVDEYTGFTAEDESRDGSRWSLLIEVNGSVMRLFYKRVEAAGDSGARPSGEHPAI
jgi:hypothetical protein